MRSIGVVTVGRSDYGIYQPILTRIVADPDLELRLFVSGAHLLPEFGQTDRLIEADGFSIAGRIPMLLDGDTPEAIAKSMGRGVSGFAEAFGRAGPDILLVLGDRFEMHAAALAALPFKMPVAHVHGGEITEGAFDDALRHSMTKLSHIHFVSTEQYARRLFQLGEERWRVTVSGAPALDHLRTIQLMSCDELARQFSINFAPAPLLITFHPVTLEYEQTEFQMGQLLEALRRIDLPALFTFPNADTNGRLIIRMIRDFVRSTPSAHFVENLGTQAYFSLMSRSGAMVGNSSSGIIEAASFKLPVVNIGSRQKGRLRAANVIDTDYSADRIVQAIRKAISPEFRSVLNELKNPYGDGNASRIIVDKLKSISLDDRLIRKVFVDA